MSSMITAMWPPSLLLAGPLADMFGSDSGTWWGGAGVIAVGLAAFLVPAIMRIEDYRSERERARVRAEPQIHPSRLIPLQHLYRKNRCLPLLLSRPGPHVPPM